jgi:hypothetical protein
MNMIENKYYRVQKGYAIMGFWRNSGPGRLSSIQYVLVGKGYLKWDDLDIPQYLRNTDTDDRKICSPITKKTQGISGFETWKYGKTFSGKYLRSWMGDIKSFTCRAV